MLAAIEEDNYKEYIPKLPAVERWRETCVRWGCHCSTSYVLLGVTASLTKGFVSLAFCSGMSMPLWLWSSMYNCSKGSSREVFLSGFRRCMVEPMGPYLCQFCKMWSA
jgi:hypothetical protein